LSVVTTYIVSAGKAAHLSVEQNVRWSGMWP
jgi:hypothetical protein